MSLAIPVAGFLLALVVIYRFGVGRCVALVFSCFAHLRFVALVSGLLASIPVTIAATVIVMAGLVSMLVARDYAPGVGEDAVLD